MEKNVLMGYILLEYSMRSNSFGWVTIIDKGIPLTGGKVEDFKESERGLHIKLNGSVSEINSLDFYLNDILDNKSYYKNEMIKKGFETEDIKGIVLWKGDEIFYIKSEYYPQFLSNTVTREILVRDYFKIKLSDRLSVEDGESLLGGVEKFISLENNNEESKMSEWRVNIELEDKTHGESTSVNVGLTKIDGIHNKIKMINRLLWVVCDSEWRCKDVTVGLVTGYKKGEGYASKGFSVCSSEEISKYKRKGKGYNGALGGTTVNDLVEKLLKDYDEGEIKTISNLLFSYTKACEVNEGEDGVRNLIDTLEVGYKIDCGKGYGILNCSERTYLGKYRELLKKYEEKRLNISINGEENITVKRFRELTKMDDEDYIKRTVKIRNYRSHESYEEEMYRYDNSFIVLTTALVRYYILDLLDKMGYSVI